MIYAIRAVGTEFVKFGYTSEVNVRDRLNALQIGCPFPLELVACGMGGDLEESEIHYHLKAAGKHQRGEWFVMSPEVKTAIEWIKNRTKPLAAMPAMKPGRKRLARVLSYRPSIETYETMRQAKARSRSGSQASRRNNLLQSSIEQSTITAEVFRSMPSLMSLESSTLRSTANSSNTENKTGETLK